METRIGRIEKKSFGKAKNGAPYVTFTIEGMNYNSFDSKIADEFQIDDYVQFDGEMRGKFWTMTAMRHSDEDGGMGAPVEMIGGIEPKPKPNGKEYHLSPEEVRCRALECALEISDVDDYPHTILERADKFVKWIYNGK